jgi:hypothetical protein
MEREFTERKRKINQDFSSPSIRSLTAFAIYFQLSVGLFFYLLLSLCVNRIGIIVLEDDCLLEYCAM